MAALLLVAPVFCQEQPDCLTTCNQGCAGADSTCVANAEDPAQCADSLAACQQACSNQCACTSECKAGCQTVTCPEGDFQCEIGVGVCLALCSPGCSAPAKVDAREEIVAQVETA